MTAGDLGRGELEVYEAVAERNAEQLAPVVRSEDVVLLHDPQTAGLVARLKQTGAPSCGAATSAPSSRTSTSTRPGTSSRPIVEGADACVFSRHAYVPGWAKKVRTEVIPPSIDAFSPKNQEMDSTTVAGDPRARRPASAASRRTAVPTFIRNDGSPGVSTAVRGLSTGPPPSLEDAARRAGLPLGPAQGPDRA